MTRAFLLLTLSSVFPLSAAAATNHGGGGEELVSISYPEQLPLAALVDYVSQTLDVQVVYGDELNNQHVILRPGTIQVPKNRLLDLLRSMLQVRNMVLVEGELPGFYRISLIADIQRVSNEIRTEVASASSDSGRIITQVIPVPSGDTKAIAERIKPFASSVKPAIIEVPERSSLVVTDYERVVTRMARLVALMDAAPEPVITKVVPVNYQEPEELCHYVEDLLSAESRGNNNKTQSVAVLSPGLVAGTVAVSGVKNDVYKAIELIQQFDTSQESARPMRIYTPQYASANRLKNLIQKLVIGQKDKKGNVELLVEDTTNRLYVVAPAGVHQRIEEFIGLEDKPTPETARRTRIYRPKNRTAGELLGTLTQLLEEASISFLAGENSGNELIADTTMTAPGANRPPNSPGRKQVPPMPPAQEPIAATVTVEQKLTRIEGPDYVLTEDEATNAIIAIGTPEFHNQLSDLITELDRKPAQVLIEMTLVAISLSDSANLGVELESLSLSGEWKHLLFSNFGLSQIDVNTGQRVLAPGIGANGILINPGDISIIFRALATHGDNRVISSPRILVSDNTAATLKSVDEAPFTSVNASDTVATTSFAGFESAGTTLTVTPHIAEGDHLTLDYDLTFSNFSGASDRATVPPPRTTNSFSGEVQVPDGYTVVVGGLEVENESDTTSEIPILGRIPVLGAIFQNSSASRTRSRIFAFLRPVILRDDRFADLKFLSQSELEDADIKNKDFPADNLMWMR